MIQFVQALGAAAASGGLGFIGQERTNNMNRDMAHTNMAFSREEAEANRKWQERMSNTAMQRQVKDYEKAGINPLLGLGQGASTPSGATGTGAMSQASNSMEGLGASAKDALALKMAMEKQAAEIAATDQSRKTMKAQEGKLVKETEALRADAAKSGFFEKLWNLGTSSAKEMGLDPAAMNKKAVERKQEKLPYQPPIKMRGIK